jgi:hypothetical protein
LEQTQVKKETTHQASTVKNIFAPDEIKARMSDETNTSNPFEIQPGKTDIDQISILDRRAGGWLLC